MRQKRLIGIILCSLLMFSTVVSAAQYEDLSENHWAYESIMRLTEAGIMEGSSEDSTMFLPSEQATRATIISALYNAFGAPVVSAEALPFYDVSTVAPYWEAVRWAYDTKITSGVSSVSFAPNEPLNREQAFSFFFRALSNSGMIKTDTITDSMSKYKDASDVSDYAVVASNFLLQEAVVSGYEDNTIRPHSYVTRAELAALLDRLFEHGLLDQTPNNDFTPTSPTNPSTVPTVSTDTNADVSEHWVMYWYLCGSDLETDYELATGDLEELFSADIDENTTVIIQTGGARRWHNIFVDADYSQRFIYDKDGLRELERTDAVNMGDWSTFEDFLTFASTNYPSENVMLNVWNHGSGTIGGIAYDEQFHDDSLDILELTYAMEAVYGKDPTNIPIDIVAFDACLMASIDVAAAMQPFAEYLVASQELAPGNGFNYTGIFDSLAKDSDMSALSLGKVICDQYMLANERAREDSETTLSVVDLKQLTPLLDAYEDFGEKIMINTLEDPSFYTRFAQYALSTENYGGNTRQEGYSNMVDLGHLARNMSDIITTESNAVLEALSDSIVYEVNGEYREEATGLSCYFPYDSELYGLNIFEAVGYSQSFVDLYSYALSDELPDSSGSHGGTVLDWLKPDHEIQTLEDMDWDDYPVTLNNNSESVLDLGPEAYDILQSVQFSLYHYDDRYDELTHLGTDDNLHMNWNRGVFRDNFWGYWTMLDGHLLYMELTEPGEKYNRYTSPVLINGVRYNLSIVYEYRSDTYSIEGARKPLSAIGVSDREWYHLKNGDQIKTIHYNSDMYIFEVGSSVEVDTFTYNTNMKVEDDFLKNGYYVMIYEMIDIRGNISYSSPVYFEVTDDYIYPSLYEPWY